jgi:hypothetical protein
LAAIVCGEAHQYSLDTSPAFGHTLPPKNLFLCILPEQATGKNYHESTKQLKHEKKLQII